MSQRTLFTVGHSSRAFAEFIALLKTWRIKELVDVRTVPRSGTYPWFSKERMKRSLPKAGIDYLHLPNLGGFRHPRKDSINTGWQNIRFRAYADYMQSNEFEEGLSELNRRRKKRRVCVMCSEAVWWRCHRRMIADAEVARGIPVKHVMSKTVARQHQMTSFAVVQKRRGQAPAIIYHPTEVSAMIHIKRAYEEPSPADGERILVERLWPRGLTKARAALDLWLKDIAPSPELRKWFGHDPARWKQFQQRYWKELRQNPTAVAELRSRIKKGPVTLIYAAHDEDHNGALALQAFLGKHKTGDAP